MLLVDWWFVLRICLLQVVVVCGCLFSCGRFNSVGFYMLRSRLVLEEVCYGSIVWFIVCLLFCWSVCYLWVCILVVACGM